MFEAVLYTVLLLAFLPLILQAFYFYTGYIKHQKRSFSNSAFEKPNVSILVPVRNEEPKILVRLLNSIVEAEYPSEKLEVIVVSDDPPEDFEFLKREVYKADNVRSLNIRFLRRTTPIGYKAGALNYALKDARGEYIVVLDSDSIVPKGLLEALLKPLVSREAVASTAWWSSITSRDSLLAEALSLTQEYLFKTLFTGRLEAVKNVVLVGSGCALSREVISSVKWSEDYVLEDVELGLRISLSNNNIAFIEDPKLKLEVPKSYYALKVQQVRWSNGAGELLRGYLGKILNSKIRLLRRLDHLLYLLQYSSPLAYLAFNVIGLLLLLLNVGAYVFKVAIYMLILTSTFYTLSYLKSALEEGYDLKRALRCLGRISAVTSSLTLDLAVSYFKGLFKSRVEWRVTPKSGGFKLGVSSLKGEAVMFTLLTIGFILSTLGGLVYASIWYLVNLLPLLYLFTNISKGVI